MIMTRHCDLLTRDKISVFTTARHHSTVSSINRSKPMKIWSATACIHSDTSTKFTRDGSSPQPALPRCLMSWQRVDHFMQCNCSVSYTCNFSAVISVRATTLRKGIEMLFRQERTKMPQFCESITCQSDNVGK